MDPEAAVSLITRLCDKIRNARKDINDWEEKYLDDSDFVVLSYGINARGVPEAVDKLRKDGIKIGWVRMKSLWPFPDELLEMIGNKGVLKVIVCEMNYGMVIREVERFRHLFKVSGITIPTIIPFSPSFLYENLKKEVK
jgi:2-oxoglutarate ferredoxin oxidoreductase subunit alpha